MPQFILIDDIGYPIQFGSQPDQLPEGAIAIGGNEDLADYRNRRWENGRWLARPLLPAPEVDGDQLWFDGLPAEAVISVNDAVSGEPVQVPWAWAGATAVTLPQGSWHVRITAPNPWLDYEALIDIDGGSPQRLVDDLLRQQRLARARVNDMAGRSRLGIVTDIPGQMAIYQAKEAEARAWTGAIAPALKDYPLIAAEVGITASTGDALAQLWLNMAHLFRLAAAASEGARMQALAEIDATTTAQIAAVTGPEGREALRRNSLKSPPLKET
jgi:hypothetical protein